MPRKKNHKPANKKPEPGKSNAVKSLNLLLAANRLHEVLLCQLRDIISSKKSSRRSARNFDITILQLMALRLNFFPFSLGPGLSQPGPFFFFSPAHLFQCSTFYAKRRQMGPPSLSFQLFTCSTALLSPFRRLRGIHFPALLTIPILFAPLPLCPFALCGYTFQSNSHHSGNKNRSFKHFFISFHITTYEF